MTGVVLKHFFFSHNIINYVIRHQIACDICNYLNFDYVYSLRNDANINMNSTGTTFVHNVQNR